MEKAKRFRTFHPTGQEFLHDNEFDESLPPVVIKATLPVSDVLLDVKVVSSEETRGESPKKGVDDRG